MKLPFGRKRKKAEALVAAYEFPDSVRRAVLDRYPGADWELVDRGLREWFICCVHRKSHMVATPSRVVDDAWDAFVLDRPAYEVFCERVFGKYLKHVPEEAMHSEDWVALMNSVYAWDRSDAAKQGDSILWSLDEQLDIDRPFGIGHEALAQVRTNEDPRYGGPFAYGGGATGGGF